MSRASYELDVLVRGKSVKKYMHQGKVYVEGRKDSEYVVTFRNNTHRKVLAVITVDGLSVIDGEGGSFDSPGYVVGAREKISIPGWRLNNNEIAKFKFGNRPDSYAESSGKGGNVGVVGCAVFHEDLPGWLTSDSGACGFGGGMITLTSTRYVQPGSYCGYVRSTSTDNTGDGVGLYENSVDNGEVTCDVSVTNSTTSFSGSVEANPHGTTLNDLSFDSGIPIPTRHYSREVVDAAPNLGTEFGRKSSHRVTEVVFNRKKPAAAVIEIHYDDRAGLEAKGVDLSAPKAYVARAFPEESKGVGCTPPADWNG